MSNYRHKKAPAPTTARGTGATPKERIEESASESKYITISRWEYSSLRENQERLCCVIRILTDPRITFESDRFNAVMAVLDLPYEVEGRDDLSAYQS